MKRHHFVNCSDEQLIRSARDEEYFRSKKKRVDPGRFTARSPSEVTHILSPDNPALPHPFLLALYLEGEHLRETFLEVGWQHQALEKRLEQVGWDRAVDVIGRIETKSDKAISTAYQLAIEKLFDVRVPECEKFLRVIRLESQRITCQIQLINRVFDVLGEARKHASLQRAASLCERFLFLVSMDLNKESLATEVSKALADLKAVMESYVYEIRRNEHLHACLEKKAIVHLQTAQSLGLTGVYLRAAGSLDDLRSVANELPYDNIGFISRAQNGADAYTRIQVRLLEIESSLELIGRALKEYSGHCLRDQHEFSLTPFENQPLPKGVATCHLEGPEGEVAVTVCSSGQKTPYRLRIKTPSFAISSAISSFLAECDLDEVILLLSTLGINTLHTDR